MGIASIGAGNSGQYGGYSGYGYAAFMPSNKAYTPNNMTNTPSNITNTASPAETKVTANAAADTKALKRSGAVECQTCKSRTYQDVSGDPGVSFKAPGHIDPASSGAVVMGHEQEHVSNSKASAAANGGRIIAQSVRLFTSVCPECGRVYVSGGETRTVTRTGSSQKQIVSSYKNNSPFSSGKHVNTAV